MKLMINFHFLKKYRFFYFDNSFDYHQIQFQFLNSMMQWKMFLKIQLKANISFLSNNIPKENELIIHVRSGDIFTNFKRLLSKSFNLLS